MAIFLSQTNYTPPQLVSYLKRVSSLITEDFSINNTGTYYNENKSVIDNAIDKGYKVQGRQDEKTAVNILFSHPNDSTQFWIYGEAQNNASSQSFSTALSAFLFFIVTILVL
jgi:cerevisin